MSQKAVSSSLPIYISHKYSWKGTFEYDVINDGHHWCYASAETWQVGDDDSKFKPMHEVAKKFNRLKTDISKSIKDKFQQEVNWSFFDWLNAFSTTGTHSSLSLGGGGLSVVLNAVVRDATLHPFELLSTFVEDNVTVEIRGLLKRAPKWFYLRGDGASALSGVPEFLLAVPVVFVDTPELKTKPPALKTELIEALRRLQYSRILHRFSVVGFERSDRKIRVTVRVDSSYAEYKKGQICGCIPVPGKSPKVEKKEPVGVNSPEVVVISPVVSIALEEISRIWQDPFAKSVLISAPPGSGKEVFATSIPYGNGRTTENLQSLSMASDDQKNLERQLYGEQRADGSIDSGLIEKAGGSALFLDEVHQPEGKKSSARASLLRPLESDEFFPLQSNQKQAVKDVLFVMATSKKLGDLGKIMPVDFWTRMTHAISIKHPLDFTPVDGEATLDDVCAKFFSFFWWDRIEKHFNTAPAFSPPDQETKTDQSKLIAHWQIHSISKGLLDTPLTDWTLGMPVVFARTFLGALPKDMSPADFSVRGIRNMVTRLFSIAASNVSQGRNMWESQCNFESDVRTVFVEIVKVARL